MIAVGSVNPFGTLASAQRCSRSALAYRPSPARRCRSRSIARESPTPITGSAAGRALLDVPAVAVRVVEVDERVPLAAAARYERATLEVHDLAHLDATLHQCGPGGVQVGYDELQPLDRARRCVEQAGRDHDRAAGSGRR